MQRRNFLKWGLTGTAAVTLPAWMASCYQSGGKRAAWTEIEGEQGPVLTAWRAAREAGKPLLVLTIPSDDTLRWQWGQAWGEALNHGPEELLADLALCEVICAEISEVRKSLPGLRDLPGARGLEPAGLLIETDLGLSVPITTEIVTIEEPGWGDEEQTARYEEAVRARIQLLGDGLRAVLLPDKPTLRYRARLAAAAHEQTHGVSLPSDWFDGQPIDTTFSKRAAQVPAVARLAAESHPQREAVIELLAGLAIARLRLEAPAGARWATSTGCGIEVEDCDGSGSPGVACGMGFTPEISSRFLYFFTEA